MNLLLHIPPETEAKLLERVRASGQDAEFVTLEALHEKLASDESSPILPLDEWHTRFAALLKSMRPSNLNADFSRESIYDGCGE
jgi:hypothetical protein